MQREQAERRKRAQLEVSRMILDVETRKQKREQLLFNLVQDEIRCELEIRTIEEAFHKKKVQEDLAAAMRKQMVVAEHKKKLFLEENHLWASEVGEKVVKREKFVKLTAKARKKVQLQYRENLRQPDGATPQNSRGRERQNGGHC